MNILLLVYDNYDFDGRASRLVSIAEEFGNVTVLDKGLHGRDILIAKNIERERVSVNEFDSKLKCHIKFFIASLGIALRKKPDLIIGANFFTAFTARIAALLVGCRYIYDAYELVLPEPDNTSSRRDLFWYWMERLSVRRAAVVLAANEHRAREMARHYNIPVPIVFRNIPDPGKRVAPDLIRILPSLPGEIRLLYQGDMSKNRGILRFVEAMIHLPSNIKLVLAGGGPDLDEIQREITRLNLDHRTICTGRVPNAELAAITKLCDTGIVTYPVAGMNNIYCAPNKIFEYAQAGLPVIASEQPPLRDAVEKYRIGEIVSHAATSLEIANRVLEIVKNREAYRQGLPKFLSDHSWENEFARVRQQLSPIFTTM